MTSLWRTLPLAATIALAACSGATTPPENRCVPIVIPAPPKMVYPANGATGVPDGNFTLVLTYGFGSSLTLSATGAPTVTTSGVTTLPNGAGYAVPALQPATTYTVTGSVVISPGPGCGNSTSTMVFGTFATI
ncbi:MAG: hypothetical protein ABSD03_04220 [Vulcanimicrobiaceae bacterium]|jgi:hypothetical protein